MSTPQPSEKVSKNDPRLFNITTLAQILGVNRAFITRMKKSGFKMPGGRATVASAHRFLEQCQDLAPTPCSRRKQHSQTIA